MCGKRCSLAVMVIAGGFAAMGIYWQEPSLPAPKPPVANTTESKATEPFEPVDDMHHFMELISQPSYRALKDALKEEPKDRSVWRSAKTHAMILAETSALVATRPSEKLDEAKRKRWA